MNLKELERYLPVNLLGPGRHLIKKKLQGRGLTEVEKHYSNVLRTQFRTAHSQPIIIAVSLNSSQGEKRCSDRRYLHIISPFHIQYLKHVV